MILRDYQAAAVDAAIHQLKTSRESSVMELATGAGKSLIVAKLAEWFNKTTGKKVLCLAPSKELVQQNHAKFLMTGSPASIYCASINKSLAHNVVFGSPQTVKNSLARFDDAFCLIIVDECHGITPSIKYIIEGMTGKQKNLRVIGLTATPYRMGDGYIYQYKLDGSPVPLEQTRDPYFNKLIVQVQAQTLIDQGYLTRPTTGETGEHYDTSELVGTVFDSHLVEKAFEGHGRLTSAIVADIVEQARYRKGVIIFCATVKHAIETLASLPPEISAMVTGETPKKEREKILSLFQKKQIKYLVNVAVLTTGFDAVHIDLVALMRATESAALMQQMIGRGLRLDEGKRDCLVLDYAGNIERHCPDGNLFNPKIKAMWKGEAEPIDVKCPLCDTTNQFSARKNDEGFEVDENGYFLDLDGNRVIDFDTKKEYPAHFGRRCLGQDIVNKLSVPCEYRWSFKECPSCAFKNDIAARYCKECKKEIIDPNEKLKIDFRRMKTDPYCVSTDKVLSWRCQSWTSAKGNLSLRVDYTTEYATFSLWYSPEGKSQKQKFAWNDLCAAVFNQPCPSIAIFIEGIESFNGEKPKTITARKNKETGFYDCYGHNREEDVLCIT